MQPGGDAGLGDFQCWARQLLRQGLVHSEDVQSWRSTFLDVEGGGRGQYLVSAADSTWRTLVVWVPLARKNAAAQSSTPVKPAALSDDEQEAEDAQQAEPERQLTVASFGPHLVRHEPVTAFAKEWAQKLPLPRAWLPVLIADVWRDQQVALFGRQAKHCKRLGFRDVDPVTHALLPLPGRGRPSRQAAAAAPPLNALDGANYMRNLYSLMLTHKKESGSNYFTSSTAILTCTPECTQM